MAKKNPSLYNKDTWVQAGVNPLTGEPLRGGNFPLKDSIKQQIKVLDKQDAIHRYKWYNLPNNITSEELEAMLYRKGQLILFYDEDMDGWWFMPYTLTSLDGKQSLDWYGRYRFVTPVPFSEGTTDEEKEDSARLRTLLSMKKLKVAYGVKLDEVKYEDITNTAFILRDYTPDTQVNVTTPRETLQDALCDIEAEMYPMMRTALRNSTGVQGMRVPNADSAGNVYSFNATMEQAVLEGAGKVPIIGAQEFQDLANGQVAKAEEYLLAMQSVDNYRLSLLGCKSGGIFTKKAHELQTEAQMTAGQSNIPLDDGLSWRQSFCTIVNSYLPLGIWCEIAESEMAIDKDGDGEVSESGETNNTMYGEESEEE